MASSAATVKAGASGDTVQLGGVLVNQGAFDLKDGQLTLVYAPLLPAARLFNDTGADTSDLRTSITEQRIVVVGAGPSDQLTVSTDGLTFIPVDLTQDAKGTYGFDAKLPAGTAMLFLKLNGGAALPFSLDVVDTGQTIGFSIDPPSATLNTLAPSPPATVTSLDPTTGTWVVTTNEFVANAQTQALQRVAQVTAKDPSQGPYTYALQLSTGSDLFTIDPTTGWLMVANGKSIDRESLGENGVAAEGRVVVTKSVGDTVEIAVRIVLRDVNDAPSISAAVGTKAVPQGTPVTFSAVAGATGNLVVLAITDDDQRSTTTQGAPVQLDLTANTVNPGVFSVDAAAATAAKVTVLGNNTWSMRLIGTKAAIESLLPSVQLRAATADAPAVSGTATYSDLGNSLTGGPSLTATVNFSVPLDNWPVSFATDGLAVSLGQRAFSAPVSGTTGVGIQSLFSSGAAGGPSNIAYASAGSDSTEWGLAVTSLGDASGTWWYSVNGGTTWKTMSLSAPTMTQPALLLPSTALLYFQRTAPGDAVSGSLTVRVWDRFGSGVAKPTAESLVDLSSAANAGLVSANAATIAAQANTTPVATSDITVPQVLANILPGSLLTDGRPGPIGMTVADLLKGVQDANGPATMGVALTGIVGGGKWFVTFDNAVTWTEITQASLSSGKALLLGNSTNTRLFYQATDAEVKAGISGGKLTVRAWDLAGQGAAGTVPLNPAANANATVDISGLVSQSGAPFSAGYSVNVAANVKPVLSSPPSISLAEVVIVPQGTSSFALGKGAGVSIDDIVAALGSSYTDENGGQTKGLAVGGASADISYSFDGGLTWNVGANYSWIFLQADGGGKNRISITATADSTTLVNGMSRSVNVRAWDGSVMANGTYLWTGENVNNAARAKQAEDSMSVDARSITVTVPPVATFNERPVLDVTKQFDSTNASRALTAFALNDLTQGATLATAGAAWTTVATLLGNGVSDRDTAAANMGIAVTGVSGGTLYWRTGTSGNGTAVTASLSATNALLLPGTASILFIPSDQSRGGLQLTGMKIKAFDTSWSGLVDGGQKSYAGIAAGSFDTTLVSADGSSGAASAFSTAEARLALNILDITVPGITAWDAVNLPFTEIDISANSPTLPVFKNVTVSTGTTANDARQTIRSIELTVTNVTDRFSEILVVDGTEVVLTGGRTVTSANNGLTIAVALGSGSSPTATVTISSTAGIGAAAASTVLNTLAYKNISDTPTRADRVVTVTKLVDSGVANNTSTSPNVAANGIMSSTVKVIPTDDMPTLSGLAQRTVREGDVVSLVPSATGIAVDDRERQNVLGIDVVLTGYDQAAETLEFAAQAGFDYSLAISGTDQVLSIRATGGAARSYADWQNSLASVNYRYSGDNPPAAPRSVTYRILDATSNLAASPQKLVYGTATQAVTITPVNDAPTAPATNSVITLEDTASTPAAIGAADVDGPKLTYSVKAGAGPQKGSVAFSGDSFVYTPTANANGTDSFTIVVSDGAGGTVEQSVSVTITAVNDAPTAPATNSVTILEDTPSAAVAIGASDVDGPTLTYAVKEGAGPQKGTVTLAGGSFVYTPKANENGTDGFTIVVSDGAGGTVEQTVSVTITPVNDAPTAPATNSVTTVEDTPSAAVAIGASDIDSPTLTYAVKAGAAPQKGSVAFANGSFVYTPTANANGTDNFTIVVSDGSGGTVEQSVSVTITPVNDAPTAPATRSVTILEDTASAPVAVGASDVDGQPLTYAVKAGAGPQMGSVTFSGDTFVYTPTANANGTDQFTIVVSDGSGGIVEQRVTVTITAVNDAPTAPATVNVITMEGTPSAAVAIGASDVDSPTLTYAVKAGAGPQKGSVTFSGDRFIYTPRPNENGTDGFTIVVSDGAGGTVEQRVSVTIKAVNDPPTAPATRSVTTDEDTPSAAMAIGATDVDSPTLTYAVKTGAGPQKGSVTFSGDSFVYAPMANANGTDQFTIVVSDDAGSTAEQVVTVTIRPVNDAPTAPATRSVTTAEDTPSASVAIGASDVDGQALTYAVKAGAGPQKGTVTFSGDSFVYTPKPNANGTDQFTIVVSDGAGGTVEQSVSVTITPVNDAPTAPATNTVTTLEDTASGTVAIGAADVDNATLTYAVKAGFEPQKGSVAFSNGSFVYTPKANENGTDSFTIVVSDGAGGTVEQSVSVTITSVNDVPTAPATNSVTTLEDTASAAVAIGASDVDGPTLSYAVKADAGPQKGTVAFSDGGFVYTPKPNANGTDQFTIAVSDGAGGTVEQSVSVTITPVNDAAVIGDPVQAILTEDQADSSGRLTASGILSITDVDVGEDLFQTTVEAAPGTRGSLALDSTGAYTYSVANDAVQDLAEGITLKETFTVRSVDGTTKQIAFTIRGVNDTAVIGDAAVTTVAEDTGVVAGLLTARGWLSISDRDAGEGAFQTSVAPVGAVRGSLTISADGAYAYSVANDAVQDLSEGTTLTETFIVKALDGTTKQLSFTVTGVNDAAVIGDPPAATLTEDVGPADGRLTASGRLSIADPDSGEAQFRTTVVADGTPRGSLTIGADGAYSYSVANDAVQDLPAGATLTETFTVTALDGTTKRIAFTIRGANDAAVIGLPEASVVTEDTNVANGRLAASGKLSVNDPDAGEAVFVTTIAAAPDTIGSLSLASDGTYTYSVANDLVQALAAGPTKVETFTVSSVDGTARTIAFTIVGTNDAAVIGDPTNAAVTEDSGVVGGQLTAKGRLIVADADAGEAAFAATVTPASGTLGSLALAADGTYTYAVGNALVQALGTGEAKVDTFTVRSRDGTEKAIRFVINGANDAPVGTVAVSGTPIVGQTLTAAASLADADGLGPVTIVWQRDGIDIPGALGPSYTLVGDDANRAVGAVARYTDRAGTAEQVASATVQPQVVATQVPTAGPQPVLSSSFSSTGSGTGDAAGIRVVETVTAASISSSDAGSAGGLVTTAPRVNLLVTTTRGDVLGSGVTGSAGSGVAGDRIEYQSRLRTAFVELTVTVKDTPTGEDAAASPPRNLTVTRADGSVIPGAVVLPNGAILLPRGLAIEQVLVTFLLADGTEVRQLLRVDLGEGSLDLVWDNTRAPPPPTFMQQLALLAAEATGWHIPLR